MGYDPGGVEQVRCHVLFDPFGVGIDFPVCTVGYTHGYSHSGPSGAGLSKRHTLVRQQWGWGEGECSWQLNCSGFAADISCLNGVGLNLVVERLPSDAQTFGRFQL